MTVKFREAVSDPFAGDIGNKTIQGRTVSKTVKLASFVRNVNAVWAANQLLQKESFPFKSIGVPLNRNAFRFQVGDVFLLNYAKYGIVDLVCRILLIEETDMQSEKIIVHCIQDVFSITKAITEYTAPTDSAIQPPDYTPEAFTKVKIIEAPYVLSESIELIPIVKRETNKDLGMIVYMSVDDGASYSKVGDNNNIQPYGTLSEAYGLTNPIDDSVGILVDFSTTDVNLIESITWADTLTGTKNMAIIGDELLSFQNITPVSGTIYRLENVIRGRFGTQQESHLINADFWFVTKNVKMLNHPEIIVGASRKFKLVPYNYKKVGSITDASVITVIPTGRAKTPYIPTNFNANGVSFAPRYTGGGDIVLTWTPRKRGEGAGVGIPGVVSATDDFEGKFKIEIYVSSILVRTVSNLNVSTWTYTDVMNVADNGTPADTIDFYLSNYIEDAGNIYQSNTVLVTCDKN